MERTKTAIVETFQQVLEETPINKITVKTIVERCGINRNTFYYYFDGIPDLVEYQLTVMADQLIDSVKRQGPKEELERIINYFIQKKKSVLHIYRYYPRDQFIMILDKIALYVVDKSIKQVTEGFPISETDQAFLIRCYKCTLVGWLLDWLEAGMSYDMSAAVERLCELMDGSTRSIIEKCSLKAV